MESAEIIRLRDAWQNPKPAIVAPDTAPQAAGRAMWNVAMADAWGAITAHYTERPYVGSGYAHYDRTEHDEHHPIYGLPDCWWCAEEPANALTVPQETEVAP